MWKHAFALHAPSMCGRWGKKHATWWKTKVKRQTEMQQLPRSVLHSSSVRTAEGGVSPQMKRDWILDWPPICVQGP